MKKMIKMIEMTMITESRIVESRMIESTMIKSRMIESKVKMIDLMMKFLVIRFCDSELLMTTCDKIFSLILFDSMFIFRNKSSWRLWTWSLLVCLFDEHDSIKTLVCKIFAWSNFNCSAKVISNFEVEVLEIVSNWFHSA